jgi:uncharacterized membrane protein
MTGNSTQDQINEAEWQRSENWYFGILYHSKRDTRSWVPKRAVGLGWTPNLGRLSGVLWLLVVLAAVALLAIVDR